MGDFVYSVVFPVDDQHGFRGGLIRLWGGAMTSLFLQSRENWSKDQCIYDHGTHDDSGC